MADRQSIEAFLQSQGPVVDVRAPAEFEKGHIPGAKNLPLFSDLERAEVGTTYKQVGRTAAVQLGLSLVGAEIGPPWRDPSGVEQPEPRPTAEDPLLAGGHAFREHGLARRDP